MTPNVCIHCPNLIDVESFVFVRILIFVKEFLKNLFKHAYMCFKSVEYGS